jgi:mannose-1-phosphate guanylyltransferase/mannose-6-phosphate isomerase
MKTKTIKRPWGEMDVFAMNEKCTVKLIKVKFGEMLSLQRHKNRDQFYLILDNGFVIRDGDESYTPKSGDTFFFKRGTVHRAEFLGWAKYGRYLEVSFGDYDEKDIERLEDKYGRSK